MPLALRNVRSLPKADIDIRVKKFYHDRQFSRFAEINFRGWDGPPERLSFSVPPMRGSSTLRLIKFGGYPAPDKNQSEVPKHFEKLPQFGP